MPPDTTDFYTDRPVDEQDKLIEAAEHRRDLDLRAYQARIEQLERECDALQESEEQRMEAQLRYMRERDEYRAQVHELTEKLRNMTSAATGAAASTVTALDRLLELEPLIDAALDWYHYPTDTAVEDLRIQVSKHIEKRRARQ